MAEPRSTPPRWWWPLALRCPWCGSRGVLERWRLAEHCPGCGLRTERVAGHSIGAIGLNTIISFSALFAMIITGVVVSWPDAPGLGWLVGGLCLAVLGPIVLLPWVRVGWLAIDVRLRPPEPGETRRDPIRR